jgi:hypothetical protein
MEFVEFLNGGASGFFRHAKASDQLDVGDKELIALAIKCLRGWLSHSQIRPAR